MQSAAIIVAAGRGERAGGLKQYRPLGGEPVLRRVLRLFAAHPGIDAVQPVIHPADEADFRAAAAGIDCLSPVAGGATRQASVRAGLEALARENPAWVLVHDAARPLASRALLDRALAAARESGAAIPVLTVNDTIKRVNAAGRVIETVAREELRAVQTPQAFAFSPLLDAHRRAAREGRNDFTDDAALMEWAGVSVATFMGEAGNLKLTTSDDFARAAAIDALALGDVRTGTGFDIHAFEPGDHIMLGGVKIPHGKGLIGHSDADVLLHALTDAVLGAIAEGDIGHHFPPSEACWRGAPSDQFLAHAVALVKWRGGRIAHLDATVLCEAPKVGPHRDAIRASIARIAGIKIGQVGVKATTTEGLGFLGRGEGIAAQASATIRLPWGAE
ncbi:MAG TPA: bifunctional 2-C-methyl-D-erythritol 4-phosphate cytidylyltransferase/2-C-methyl-D-erythritol 2,4-cyclodiphosphate synthase [Xanthobacteraceae bacterium]|nr:bifunctional 2-C-methyl-D-erythritol 4-phosphate cytidylyltransferase/2-C-methyl-D-erythritol 2,4-cyclodiphosphate synthase [Xanthobacteraceae bacterium]